MINNIMNIAEYKHETVSGQGSVSWDDGIKCYIPSVKVKGKAEQEMYSGINLWNNLAIGLRSVGGVTISEVTSDHIIISTGEGYNDNGYVETNVYLRDICPTLEAGKTYYLWGNSDSVKKKRIYLLGSYVTWYFGGSHTITEADLKKPIALYGFAKSEGESIGDCRISNIMVTESSVQPNYEPYVGGMAAPNPQYPFYPNFTAPKLASHGKNLFDISDVTTAFNSRGVRVPVSQNYPYQIYPNGEIEIGVSSSYNGLYWSDNGVYLPAGIYTVSADLFIPSTSTSTIYNFGVRNFDENTSFLQRFTDSKADEWFRATYTFTATNGVYRFLAQIVGGSSYTDVCVRIKNIQIEKNNTYTGFEKFFSGGVVQCPELYATIGNKYSDTCDTQTGNITRKILKALLTGNETITASTAFGNGVRIANVFEGASADGYIGLCSHAVVGESMHFTPLTGSVFWHNILGELNMTLEEFKVWLAEQYSSGKPVTIWYPLSHSTEETVPMPEKLKMPKGSGQIIQTDSGLVADVEAKVLKHS